MSLLSPEFGLLLAAWLGWLIAPPTWTWLLLLTASLLFVVSVQGVAACALALAATAVTYYIGLVAGAASAPATRRRWSAVGIVLLVAALAAWKYWPVVSVYARPPLGLSFFTILLVGYLVDVARGAKAERHFGIFAVFVLFAPKLISGPIERATRFLPQLHQPRGFDYGRTVAGLQRVVWGAFKKFVVADRLSPVVAAVYDNPQSQDGVTITIATLLYAFQLYADFSGYTDMALGTAKLFGYDLAENFNAPYAATSVQDFWKRWHISLTSWLTDYVYTPLSRQKRLPIKFFHMMLAALFTTFLISGVWHGSTWTFVAWGALHGSYVVTSVLTQKMRAAAARAIGLSSRPTLHHAVRVATTFALVCLAYVFFRANSLQDALHFLSVLGTGWGRAVPATWALATTDIVATVVGLLGIALLVVAETGRWTALSKDTAWQSSWAKASLTFCGAASVTLLGGFYEAPQQFLYFRF